MSEFKLGEHEQAIRQLAEDMATVKTDVAEIKMMLAEKRGERRIALWAAGAAGSIAATVISLALKLMGAWGAK